MDLLRLFARATCHEKAESEGLKESSLSSYFKSNCVVPNLFAECADTVHARGDSHHVYWCGSSAGFCITLHFIRTWQDGIIRNKIQCIILYKMRRNYRQTKCKLPVCMSSIALFPRITFSPLDVRGMVLHQLIHSLTSCQVQSAYMVIFIVNGVSNLKKWTTSTHYIQRIWVINRRWLRYVFYITFTAI